MAAGAGGEAPPAATGNRYAPTNTGDIVDKKWLIYGGLVLAGVVFASRIRSLPVLNKLPTL